MSNYCGKCGSKLDAGTGLCPNCTVNTPSVLNGSEFYNKISIDDDFIKKKDKSNIKKKIIITVSCFIVVLAFFFVLDFFDIIGTGACKALGIKSSGILELYVDSDYIFTSDNGEQTVLFYALPKSGFTPVLEGDLHTELFDDGDGASHGDAKKRDGVYTAKVNITEKDEKTLSVYAVAKNGLRFYKSEKIEIQVKKDWSAEDIAVMEDVDSEVVSLLTSTAYQSKTIDEKADAVIALLDTLSVDGKVKPETVFYDDESYYVSFEYANGALGDVQVIEKDYGEGVITGESQINNETSTEASNMSVENNTNSITSSDSHALIIYDWFTDKPEVQAFYEVYEEEWNDFGIDTTLLINPTVDQYATQLSDMELILIAAHGNRQSIKKGWFSSAVTYSTIDTNESVSKDTDRTYKTDINEKNIVRVTLVDGKQVYWLLPGFFASHYTNDELGNTILLMDNCNGMGSEGDIDYDLASSMIGNNSAAVGFHNSVEIFKYFNRTNDTYYTMSYGTLFMDTVIQSLFAGNSFSDAEQYAEQLIGSNEKEYLNAYWGKSQGEHESIFPVYSGYGNAKLNISKDISSKEFDVADGVLKVEEKYIVSDKKTIYYKNNMTEPGRKVVSKTNTGQIMSDGETIYFTVSNGTKNGSWHEQYDVFKTDIYGSSPTKVFSGKYDISLAACYNDSIYYIDADTNDASNVTFLGDLMKYDINTKQTDNISGSNIAAVAQYFNGKIYYHKALLSIDYLNDMQVFAVDLQSGKTEVGFEYGCIYNNTNDPDRLYFRSSTYKNGELEYLSFSSIDKSNKLTHYKEIPQKYNGNKLNYVEFISSDEPTAIMTSFDTPETFDLFLVDMETGKVTAIKNGAGVFKNKGYGITYDLATKEIYFCVGTCYKYSSSGLQKMNCDYVLGYESYWIVDGWLVNQNLECFELG